MGRNKSNDLRFVSPQGATDIPSLIAGLGSKNGLARHDARQGLVAIGKPAVAPLTEALNSSDKNVRWEAAKALGEIGDPKAAKALVASLDDEEPSVRWLAVEALVGLGREGLPALLQALERHSDSIYLRQSAHHVLKHLSKKGLANQLAPVLAALDDVEPAVEVPIAARNALEQLAA